MGSLLFVVAEQMKPGAPAKPGAAANSAASTAATTAKAGAVRVWEEKVVIPTYLLGEPDPNPQFYFGGTRRARSTASIHIPRTTI